MVCLIFDYLPGAVSYFDRIGVKPVNLSVSGAFSAIPEHDVERLRLGWSVRSFRKGEFIYRGGNVVREVLVVVTGQVMIYRLTAEGKLCTIRTLGAEDFIGEEDLLEGGVTESYGKSVTQSRCLAVPQSDYEYLLSHYPTFARTRLHVMSTRLKTAERMMQEIAYSTVKQRILLILTKIGNEIGQIHGDELEFTLNWSHHELASMIGSTRETVTTTLALLQKEGLITITGKRMTITPQASLDGAHMQ